MLYVYLNSVLHFDALLVAPIHAIRLP